MKKFNKEFTSVWSFPERDSSFSHTSSYPGNFSPQTIRNLILQYTKEHETVLDPMAGGGTSVIESKLLNRHCIAMDINPEAVELCRQAADFKFDSDSGILIKCGDARKLDLKDNSVDFIMLHPPYFNIIKYSKGEIEGDLSNYSRLSDFLDAIEEISQEAYRILKPGRYCALLIGDTRRNGHYIPLSVYVLLEFLEDFVLKEEIIKIQHHCRSTSKWKDKAIKRGFYLIMHEHLYILHKLNRHEKRESYKYSSGIKRYCKQGGVNE